MGPPCISEASIFAHFSALAARICPDFADGQSPSADLLAISLNQIRSERLEWFAAPTD
jgi:hypothetical protein